MEGLSGKIVEIEPHSHAALELDAELHGDKAVQLELGKGDVALGQLAGDGLAIEHARRELQGRDELSAGFLEGHGRAAGRGKEAMAPEIRAWPRASPRKARHPACRCRTMACNATPRSHLL